MNIFYKVIQLKHEGRERKGFILNRPDGTQDFLFLHFKTPVKLLQNGEITSITPGTCVIFTPNTRHWFESPDSELVHDWVHFIPDKPEEFFKLGLPINRAFNPSRVNYITPAVMACESEFIHKEFCWEYSVSATLSVMFIRIARELLIEKATASSRYMLDLYEKYKKFRLDMYNQADKSWRVVNMAGKLNLSRSRFTILYKEFFGVSPKQDLILARIARAKYLLENSDLTISQIAQMTGYTNIYHFVRQFKSSVGVSPGLFRK